MASNKLQLELELVGKFRKPWLIFVGIGAGCAILDLCIEIYKLFSA